MLIALAPSILPMPEPIATDWNAVRKAPSSAHWLGTDEIGPDILSRKIRWGARASLMAGAVSVVIGAPFGVVAGYFSGWVDMLASRVAGALPATPLPIPAIALTAFWGPARPK